MSDRVGQQLGNYRLVRLLGRGGFAEVYLGEHLQLGTQAAVKVLHAQLMQTDLERFRKEAQIIARLYHPHIVRLLEFDAEQGTPYLVIEYAPHGNLRERYPRGAPLPLKLTLTYIQQIASALQYAHDQKLIHRDIKPENLLVGRNNEVLLSDFGIAVVAQSTSQQRTQGFAGTTAYSAPEQLLGKPQVESDQYSLGIVVYEWLCGKLPFQGDQMAVAFQHERAPVPPLSSQIPNLPLAVEQVVLKALAKDPHLRFASVTAFAQALEQASQGDSPLLFATTQVVNPSSLDPTVPLRPPSAADPSMLAKTVPDGVTPSQPFSQFELAPTLPTAKRRKEVQQDGSSHRFVPSLSETRPSPPLSRRQVMVGLAGLAVVGGGATLLALSRWSQGGTAARPTATTLRPTATTAGPTATTPESTTPPLGTTLVTFHLPHMGR